ncbi:MAG: 23S rRNA (pseudouridine(1915)-N(3))-methyltransferase RlmH [Firmicutes bacterium]|nr:23S rRNA (pseudouridine(1915)-N(3))-methyltransferase RlmH [Bacillota bacterium]
MNVRIIAVGRLKERFLTEGIKEYSKRIARYGRLVIVELKEESFKEPLSSRERELIMFREGERILNQLGTRSFVCVLDRTGDQMSSQDLADKMSKLAVSGVSQMDFVIGGSLGLDQRVLDRADSVLSFSEFTFPHQLMRLILVEQVYRAMTIIRGERYHK